MTCIPAKRCDGTNFGSLDNLISRTYQRHVHINLIIGMILFGFYSWLGRLRLGCVLENRLVLGLGDLAGVPCPDVGLSQELARHPDVVDWLLTVTEKQAVRRIYLDWLCRFLQWTHWRD